MIYLHHQSAVLFPFKICFDFVVGIFLRGFNRRCRHAVFSKFMPHIFSCGCPYDVTQQVGKKHSIVFKSFKSIQSKITLTIIFHHDLTETCGYLKNYFYPQICIMLFVCIFHFFPGPGVL